jgi:hypothetical protein
LIDSDLAEGLLEKAGPLFFCSWRFEQAMLRQREYH